MLTIVTITRNDSEGLMDSVSSCAELRAAGVYHVVVDGSDEGVFQKNAALLPREAGLVHTRQDGSGISAAFNQGLALAREGWIWYINGGDRAHPDLDAGYLFKTLELTVAEGVIFDLDCQTHRTQRPPICYLWPPIVNWVPHPSVLLRTEVLRRFKGFRTDFRHAMDAELWMRMLHANVQFDLISYPVAMFSIQPGASTQGAGSAREMLRIAWDFRWKLLKRWVSQFVNVWRAIQGNRRLVRRFQKTGSAR